MHMFHMLLLELMLNVTMFHSCRDVLLEVESVRHRIGGTRRKLLSTIDERGSELARNSVFDCHLPPVGRQMAIENYISNFFDLR